MALMFVSLLCCCGRVQLLNPRCEYQQEALGIDNPSPRFSWEYGAAPFTQRSYRLEVAADRNFRHVIWDSGEVLSQRQMAVYAGTALESFKIYWWRVSTRTDGGRRLRSETRKFETAFMPGENWQGQWISDGHDKDYAPAPMLRKQFRIEKPVARARLYISAAAYYDLSVNGRKAESPCLDPGFTDYSKTNLYSTLDLTDFLVKGDNVLAAVLGNGFYNEIEPVATWDFDKAAWRGRARMIAELHISYRDGSGEVVGTGPDWKTSTGPSLSNNIYSGEIYDARLEIPGWDRPGFNDSAWQDATVVPAPSGRLAAQQNPPARECEVLHPAGMRKFSDTLYVYSFDKNISGVCTLNLPDCAPGIKFRLRHGELLKDDGSLECGNIGIYFLPKEDFEIQTDIYYTKGGKESFTPRFTYHGFQYVEVSSSESVELRKEDLSASFIHTDLDEAGSFKCSEPLVNRICDAARLSYLGNLVSIPTDCPQREKNGWTADANLAIDLGLLNFDGITFYEKWIGDMADSQRPDGNVPGIVPTSGWGYDDWIGPVWASAIFMVPDALMRYYGDSASVMRIYDICERYLDYLSRRLDGDGTVTYGIGDWVYYDTPTPTDYSTTVFYYWQNVLMGRFAVILGKDPAEFEAKAAFLKDLVNRKHFDSRTCLYGNGSQAGQAMALMFGVVPEEYRERVAANLNRSIVENGYMLDFGSVGSKFVPRVLADCGYADTVYKMMLQDEVPSWGAWLKMGLTTLAERWALDFDGFHDSSANHVFLGDIAAWAVKYLAGIRFEMSPEGLCDLSFVPCTPEGLDWAEASYKSVRGMIRSSWKRTERGIVLDVEVPANIKAKASYGGRTVELEGGRHTLEFDNQ